MRSRTLNRICLIGNLVKKPDLNQTKKGISVCNFHLITNREWKDGEGNLRDESEKHNCLAWSRLAEICHELLDKGTLVFIEGRLNNRKFLNREGQEVSETVVVVNDMIVLDQKRRPQNEGNYGPRYTDSENY